MRLFESARAIQGATEGATNGPKQLCRHEVARQRGEIYREEWTLAAAGEVNDLFGQCALARARLAENQKWQRGAREHRGVALEPRHGGAVAPFVPVAKAGPWPSGPNALDQQTHGARIESVAAR